MLAQESQAVLVASNHFWFVSKEADVRGRMLADRHYSRKTIGAPCFAGVGEKVILLTYDFKALFVWRRSKPEFREDGQFGVECSIFRNEGNVLSSELILDAEQFAFDRWGPSRLFTYIDDTKIRSSTPGHCFIKAGWRRVDGYRSKDRGLLLFEKLPPSRFVKFIESVPFDAEKGKKE